MSLFLAQFHAIPLMSGRTVVAFTGMDKPVVPKTFLCTGKAVPVAPGRGLKSRCILLHLQ